MKKICVILLLAICLFSAVACDSSGNGEHQHEWSELACGSKQHCLTCGEEKGEIIDHRWSEPVCDQKQICLICGKLHICF